MCRDQSIWCNSRISAGHCWQRATRISGMLVPTEFGEIQRHQVSALLYAALILMLITFTVWNILAQLDCSQTSSASVLLVVQPFSSELYYFNWF